MPVRRFEFGFSQLRLFTQQLTGTLNIARHEDAEGGLKTLADALVESGQLRRAFWRELIASLDFLDGELAQILVDDVADMFEVDSEGHDLHGAAALALVETVARELGDVELDRVVQAV